MNYLTVTLLSAHHKKDFECGNVILDDYLQKQAKQDMKRKLAICFVLADENNKIKGYYTLSSAGIPNDLLPDEIKKKLPPSYTNLPVTLLGRLAISNAHKGQGLGELLLLDALKRSYDNAHASIGSMAVIVDPIDLAASKFYQKYGFISLHDSDRMFLPMRTIAGLFEG